MTKAFVHFVWIFLLQGFLLGCGNSTPDKETPLSEEEPTQEADSSSVQKKSAYEHLLKKFKLIAFDTLKVYYTYEEKGNRFFGKELTLKEAKSLPIGITENYFGKLSGVYACYRFPIDSSRLGVITRIPAEYESTSIVLLLFDLKKDRFLDEYYHLAASTGDAGELYVRTSWLFKTKQKQFHSLVYNYQSSTPIDDTLDLPPEEWRSYMLINCMSPKFDTLSTNEAQLKKRFRRELKTEE